MITVGLVDDHSHRTAVRLWLEANDDLHVVADAATVPELRAACPKPPDVVVLDIRLADGSSFADNITRLHEWGTRIVVMTADTTASGFRELAFHSNVAAFLEKQVDLTQLADAIRRAPDGEQQMTSAWAAHLGTPRVHLTPTETKVIRLYAIGMTHDEIAHALDCHVDTARKHIVRIRAKYRDADRPSGSRAELTGEVRRDGHLPDH